jgi:hypothetical protein
VSLLDLLGSEWNEWRIVLMVPLGWPARSFALAVAALTLLLAWRALRHDSRRRRRLLLALRTGGVLAVLFLFFQPALKLRNVTRLPNHIAVLVDTSESMSLAEQGSGETRAARAAALLAREQPELLRWQGQHKIDFYTFGDRLQPATAESLTRPGGHPAHADATRVREALAAVRQRYEGRDLAGVVLLSDGLDNGRLSASDAALGSPRTPEPGRPGAHGDGKKDAARDAPADSRPEVFDADTRDFLRTLDAPVHTVAVGRPGLHDVAIARVLADQFAFARTAVEVEARLQVLNAEAAGWQGRSLPVTLRRDGVPVLTVDVDLRPGQSEYRVIFPFTPERVGKYLYEISTPVLPGEAIAENNHRTFILKVVRDKIRVVHVAGRPTWDARFLRGLLKHDPNIDLVAFFILRSPSDLEPVPSEETSLIPFPCEELFQEQLRSFDLIILHNFNYTAYCGQYLQPAIVPFVNDGGAVAMIGGDLSFSSGGYYGSELAQILPVVLNPDDGGGLPAPGGPPLVDPEPFHPRLTPAGKSHVVTALRLDVKENSARWDSLPPLEGLNLVARARPQATVLLAHPKHKDADGNPMPVLTVAEFGKGRTLALQADSSWRWGFGAVTQRAQASVPAAGGAAPGEEGDARGSGYQRFYEQAIRWLIRDPALRLLRIETSDTEYRRDQPVRVEVRAFGSDYQPAQRVEVTLSIARVGTPELSSSVPAPPAPPHTVRTDEEGAASTEWPALPPGGYRVTARALLGGRPAEDTEVFVVRGAARELENPEADDRLLQQLSRATSGVARSYADRAGLSGLNFQPPHIVHVNQHRDIELWNNWAVLLLGVVCFSLNWMLRRRWGYA